MIVFEFEFIKFEEVFSILSYMKFFKKFNMWSNFIKVILDELCKLWLLEELDVFNNELVDLFDSMSNMKNLWKLNVFENKI